MGSQTREWKRWVGVRKAAAQSEGRLDPHAQNHKKLIQNVKRDNENAERLNSQFWVSPIQLEDFYFTK